MDQSQIQKTLMDEFGLSDLSQEKQEELVVKMTEVLLKRIFLETMEKLDEESRGEYEKLVESGAEPDKVEEFLKEKIKDYDAMVQKVVEDFKEEMRQAS